MRRKARVDDNQAGIVDMLRKIPGVSVAVTSSLGDGFVDIIVGKDNFNYMIELKDGNKKPSAQKLTPKEEEFRERWKGQYTVCNSFDEVYNLITGKKK